MSLWSCAGTPRATHTGRHLNPQIRWIYSPLAAQRAGSQGEEGALPGAEVSSSFSEQWALLVLALLRPVPPKQPPPLTGSRALELDAEEPGWGAGGQERPDPCKAWEDAVLGLGSSLAPAAPQKGPEGQVSVP